MARNQIMPSNRRIKVFGLLVFISVITLLFYTGSIRQSRAPDTRTSNDFYSRTVNALNHEHDHVGGGSQLTLAKAGAGDDDEDDEGRRERLKEAAKVAKGNANAKAPKPDPPSLVIGKGSAAEGSVAGRKSYPIKDKDGEGADQKPVVEKVETPEEHEVEVELNSILKKSPIIVFSKSYCPHSKRAKNILERYTIDPKPYIVELDLHPLGLQIQASLADMTGRRTVPNILINGKSIGGGDEVSGLHSEGKLIDTVKRMGGKRMLEVSKKVAGEKNEDDSGDKQHDSGLRKRDKSFKKAVIS